MKLVSLLIIDPRTGALMGGSDPRKARHRLVISIKIKSSVQ